MKAAFSPGTTFASYRVESLLGRGGMGVVYPAHDPSLERPVALKLIAPELVQDEEFRRRFLREPKLAAALDHPNVIPIYEAGEHEGQLYLAMRYVKGTDMRALLDREGKLSPERTIEVLAQIAGALDAAHERGLVHRDVKPANVLLDEAGHPYLTDFGITKPAGGDSTDTGQVVGTLDYLAPEQIRGEEVDGRTDCYALACVLYECLAGAPPFRRRTEAETLWAHMQGEAPPLRGRPELNRVLARALAKERDARYPSCGAFIAAASKALGLAAPGPAARVISPRAHPTGRASIARGRRGTARGGGPCRARGAGRRRGRRAAATAERHRGLRGGWGTARILHRNSHAAEQPRRWRGLPMGAHPRGPHRLAHRSGDEEGREALPDQEHSHGHRGGGGGRMDQR